MKKSRSPDGDHSGLWLIARSFVTCTTLPPATGTITIPLGALFAKFGAWIARHRVAEVQATSGMRRDHRHSFAWNRAAREESMRLTVGASYEHGVEPRVHDFLPIRRPARSRHRVAERLGEQRVCMSAERGGDGHAAQRAKESCEPSGRPLGLELHLRRIVGEWNRPSAAHWTNEDSRARRVAGGEGNELAVGGDRGRDLQATLVRELRRASEGDRRSDLAEGVERDGARHCDEQAEHAGCHEDLLSPRYRPRHRLQSRARRLEPATRCRERLEHREQLGRGLPSIRRQLGEAAHHRVRERGRDAGAMLLHRIGNLGHVCGEHLLRRPRERQPPR